MTDFNAPESTAFNAGRSSDLNARKRWAPGDLYILDPLERVPGFITGKIGDALTVPDPDTQLWSEVQVPDLGTGSYTIRLWMYQQEMVSRIVIGGYSLLTLTSPDAFVLRIESGNLEWNVNYGGASPASIIIPGPLPVATWFRALMWYDRDNDEIGIQIDDDTPETAAASDPGPLGPECYIRMSVPGGVPAGSYGHEYDELAIWSDRALTEDERDMDWNSGDGLGWPETRDTLPGLGSYYRFDEEDLDSSPDPFPVSPSLFNYAIVNMIQ